ncbi:MAG: VanZ family protein [Lachnospiraceae bacterium]|nr:VanZ family protein [Lachnospiraceae bacterium]
MHRRTLSRFCYGIWPRSVCICLIATLCGVEILQFVTSRGSMDIDDVILNFVGAFIVYLLAWNKRMSDVWYDIGLTEDDMHFPS